MNTVTHNYYSGRDILNFMRKALSALVIFAFTFYPFAFTGFVPAIANAHSPTLSIESIDGQSTDGEIIITLTTIPQVVDVEVLIGHSSPGNTNSVKDLTLFVNNVQHGSDVDMSNGLCGGESTCTILMPWSISEGGDYELFVSAYHGNKDTDTAFSLTVEVEVVPPDPEPENPTIKAVKIVDEDGDLDTTEDQSLVDGWEFEIDGDTYVTDESGETIAVEVEPGTYSVTETVQEGYDLIGASCEGATENGSFIEESVSGIEADSNQIIVCTFYNAPLGQITVEKVTNPESETEFDFSWNLGEFSLSHGLSEWLGYLFPGEYTIEESSNENYETSVECTNDQSGFSLISFFLGYGQNITCTFTNTFVEDEPTTGTLIIEKYTEGSNGEFSFDGDFEFTIVTEEGYGYEEFEVEADSYYLYEIVPEDWYLDDLYCNGDYETDGNELWVWVGSGDEITCTFVNVFEGQEEDSGTLIIEKYSYNYDENTLDGEFSFDGDFEFTIVTEEGYGYEEFEVEADSYYLYEIVPEDWYLDDLYCNGDYETDGNELWVWVGSGDEITCTFVNVFEGQEENQDITPPVSTFDNTYEHETIDTEIVALSLSSQSTDNVGPAEDPKSGVHDSVMNLYKLFDEEAMQSEGFFSNIFPELNCSNLGETILIEIVALNLTSAEPFPVSWGPLIGALDRGVYCGIVHATDNAGNVEHTAVVGPFAYTFTPPPLPPPSPPPSPPPPSPPSNNGGGSGGGGTNQFAVGIHSGPSTGGASGEVLGESTGEVLGESCGPLIGSYIKLGANNNSADVSKLQQFLNEYMSAGLPITGFYGPLSFAAVKAFQMKEAPEVLQPWIDATGSINEEGTGYVYKTTKRRINNLSCEALDLPIPQLP